MKKKTKVALSVVASVVAVLFIALMIYYFGASFPAFDAIAKKEFGIPGLNTDFCPQGLAYDDTNDTFLVGGYMSKGGASRVYFVNYGTKELEKYVTFSEEGAAYTGHCGGVTISGDYGWIVGDKKVHRFSYLDAKNAENGGVVNIIDSFSPGNGADFVLVRDNKLIVGEFFRKNKYDTDESHHIKVSGGKTNYALSLAFEMSASGVCGLASLDPVYGISTTSLVQGMTFTKDDNIVLSTSYSIPASKILVYKNVLNDAATKSVKINETDIPVYVLDDETLVKSVEAPCMSEEIVLAHDKVFVLFESACKKYKMFTRTRLTDVYSLSL